MIYNGAFNYYENVCGSCTIYIVLFSVFLTTSKIEHFNSSLLKLDKKSYKNIDMSYIGYMKMKSISAYESIASVNPLYFIVSEANKSIEEKNENKYLVFY